MHSLAGERPGGHGGSGGGVGGWISPGYICQQKIPQHAGGTWLGVEAVICDTEWLDGGRGGERP